MLERLQRKGFGYERCFACLKALVLASRCASTIIIGRFSHGSRRSNYLDRSLFARAPREQRLEADENLARQYLEPPLGFVARIDGLDRIEHRLRGVSFLRRVNPNFHFSDVHC
jgi:hypothetical protein